MSARVALVQPHAGLLKLGGGGGASSSIFGMQSATDGMQQLVAARYFRRVPFLTTFIVRASSTLCRRLRWLSSAGVAAVRWSGAAVMRCKRAVLWNPLALNSLSTDAF